MFNFFEELFAPGRKHTSDEQKRLELTRVDLGVGDPGRGPIDLASGKVVVRAPGADSGTGTSTGAEAEADAGADAGRKHGRSTEAVADADGPDAGGSGAGGSGAQS
ncbi:DUF6191 domain-containing protein [Streptomyces sp. NBC_00378]|uniref:DUF6191 domain-containing protein n=1 Tax=unclassified Streptomyces TaxID=2593676 RepID=UPI00225695AB|nr:MULTISPECIES: DUF6191 domain-containing protein [unclassified Streptomyces]MCX5109155.1 DUF6191 domain-containing protein [Streptomyces sp. NBC_00378]